MAGQYLFFDCPQQHIDDLTNGAAPAFRRGNISGHLFHSGDRVSDGDSKTYAFHYSNVAHVVAYIRDIRGLDLQIRNNVFQVSDLIRTGGPNERDSELFGPALYYVSSLAARDDP